MHYIATLMAYHVRAYNICQFETTALKAIGIAARMLDLLYKHAQIDPVLNVLDANVFPQTPALIGSDANTEPRYTQARGC